ncbi:hypothetical protein [Microvirga lotononidis]|nr:hypothetical protein [Microvirga lotononidis]WQO30878.1 hypothetical protein U0023_26070 [Microvirga lotononidis]
MVLSGACALVADVSSARVGVLIRIAYIAPGRIISAAAGTSTITVAVSSAVIAGALGTSTAAVSAPAIAGFRESERTLNMRQEGVSDMETDDHRTAYGDHRSRDQKSSLSARQGRYIALALTRPDP